MSILNELFDHQINFYLGPEDDGEEVIDDEDLTDDGPANDPLDKGLPSDEINIPEKDE